jgi:hypothetical protein
MMMKAAAAVPSVVVAAPMPTSWITRQRRNMYVAIL